MRNSHRPPIAIQRPENLLGKILQLVGTPLRSAALDRFRLGDRMAEQCVLEDQLVVGNVFGPGILAITKPDELILENSMESTVEGPLVA